MSDLLPPRIRVSPGLVEDVMARIADHPLTPLVSERRMDRMIASAAAKLTSVTVAAENLYDSHNVSAIVRTAEGFGLDAVHIVEQPHPYRRNRSVLRGSDRWMEIKKHPSLYPCLEGLKAEGFSLCVADVGKGCVGLDEIPVDGKVAVVMGSEHDGLSRRAKQLADVKFTIPMTGFTESFNVSVSAAIALHDITRRRREVLGDVPGELDVETIATRIVSWMRRSIKNAKQIEALALAARDASR